MRRLYTIFGLAVIGVSAAGAGLSVGVSAWIQHAASVDWGANEPVAPSGPEQPDVPFAALRDYAARYGIVEVQAERDAVEALASGLPEQEWHVRFLASILPPGDAAVFNVTASEPVNADVLESSGQEHPVTEERNARSRLAAGDPDRVLNDAQVASIKGRLKLTPNQQRMWPAVEAALRKVTYAKRTKSGNPGGYIDLDDPAVRQLESAALPLLKHLSEDQKLEIKSLAHVMGLDALAALL